MTTEAGRHRQVDSAILRRRAVNQAFVRALDLWSPRLVTVGLLSVCFSAHWGDLGSPVALDRLILAGGLAASLLRARVHEQGITLRPVHLLLAAVTVWTTLSALFSGSATGEGFFALLDRFGIIPFALFCLAGIIFRTEDDRRFLARSFTLFALYLGLVSICQMTGIDALVWPSYILDPTVGLHFDRARGPYVEGVANGLMLGISAALAGISAVSDPDRRWRWLAWVALPLSAVGILLTLTRAVWLGALLAAVVLIMVVPRVRKHAPIFGFGGIALVAIAYMSVPGLAESASERGGEQWSLWDRYNTNLAAARMFLANPVWGVGWHQAAERMSEFVRQGPSYPVTSATVGLEVHNVFLSRLAELGLVGAALWALALGSAVIFPILRRPELPELQPWRAALLAVAVMWAVAATFGPLPYPQPNYMLWIISGLVLSQYLAKVRPASKEDLTICKE